jgi:hypothetical protein
MFRFPRFILVSAGLTVFFGLGVAQAASLSVYLSPPGIMSTEIIGATTETFDSVNAATWSGVTYQSPIGDYVGNNTKLPIIAADQYGGANNSNYMYVGTRHPGDSTSVTLTLATPEDYFGFWWSAGDSHNQISVYSGGVLIATFVTADITTLLSKNPLIALSGVQYQTSAYMGNPNTGTFHGKDASEPFAYVNLVASGFTFDKLVLTNDATSGFENDNHSVYALPVDIPRDYSSFVKVVDVPFTNNPVPEPGYSALAGLFLSGATYWGLRAKSNQLKSRDRPRPSSANRRMNPST